MLATRLIQMIFKIAFSVLFLLFINNPIEPLSVPIITDEVFRFVPIFHSEYVLNYQIIFSLFALAGLMIGIIEFIVLTWKKYAEIFEEGLGIIQLWFIRDIPREALNLPENILDKLYPIGYWFLSFIMLLATVGIIIKVIKLLADYTKPIKPN